MLWMLIRGRPKPASVNRVLVRAETEEEARQVAVSEMAADMAEHPWSDEEALCVRVGEQGDSGIIIRETV
jgi:hypothetical protein